MFLFMLFFLAIIVIMIASVWRVYEKAGQPGWASIIPIYNLIVLLRIVEKPTWWIFLLLIPVVNLVIAIWVINLLMKKFGKDELWTIGMIFIPFIIYPMLAWGDAQYQGSLAADHPDILDSGFSR